MNRTLRIVAWTAVLLGTGTLCAQDTANRDTAIRDFGYRPDPEATREFVQSLPEHHFHVGDGVGAEPEEFQNYRYVLKCLASNPSLSADLLRGGRLIAPNQGSVGSCTGFGTAGALNIALAKFCLENRTPEWYTPISESAAYANGRESGGMLGQSDGGYGSACAKSTEEIGMLRRMPYPSKDLTDYTVSDARELGRYGIGRYGLKPDAFRMRAGTVFQVRSAEDAKSALRDGFAINVCSMQAFRTVRDVNGICEADNTRSWAHSMTVVGFRTVAIDGRTVTLFRLQQSWGDNSPSGPLVDDMGYGMFDIREEVMDRMLSRGDSFAYGDLVVEDAPPPGPMPSDGIDWFLVLILFVFVIASVRHPQLAMVVLLIGVGWLTFVPGN